MALEPMEGLSHGVRMRRLIDVALENVHHPGSKGGGLKLLEALYNLPAFEPTKKVRA